MALSLVPLPTHTPPPSPIPGKRAVVREDLRQLLLYSVVGRGRQWSLAPYSTSGPSLSHQNLNLTGSGMSLFVCVPAAEFLHWQSQHGPVSSNL